MSGQDLVENVLLLAPGFIFLKLVALFGGQNRRLEWEWVVWSVIAALPIAAGASIVRIVVDAAFPVYAGPVSQLWEVIVRFGLAVLLGVIVAHAWRLVKASHSRKSEALRRFVSDSAWDTVLDEATRCGFGVEVTVKEGDAVATYYGRLATFGYEAASAEPWVHLRSVSRWEGKERGQVRLDPRTDGMMFHRDVILRVRFIKPAPIEPAGQA